MSYRVGEWVEVRSPEDIVRTLDGRGALDNMPFMPEMLKFTGKRFRVTASAHKACDTIDSYENRRITDSVHLGLRCDGSAHGGCQAECLLYWKNDWLKPVGGPGPVEPPASALSNGHAAEPSAAAAATLSAVTAATRHSSARGNTVRYSCQATRLVEASTPLRKRDLRQYFTDFASGNVGLWTMVRYMLLFAYNMVASKIAVLPRYPSVKGRGSAKTPMEALDLEPGELVEVKSKIEIEDTLNAHGKNRGMSFDEEMVPFCGKKFRVRKRVDRLIDEKTGEIVSMKTPCIVLEEVVCLGHFHPGRMFCPRAIYPYWREIWLKRVQAPSQS